MKTEYSDSQYSSNYPDGVENHWWNLVRNDFIHRLVRRLGVPHPAVIEIGCGKGIVVSYLRKRGVNCVGAELADVQPVPGAEQHVRAGTSAFDLPAEERAGYDIIMVLDVLEHLPDPQQFIRSLIKAYPNARSMIVTVPACAELWSNYDEHYGHFMRYSTDQLISMLREAGLAPIATGYFFHSVYLPALLGAKLKRDRAVDISAPRGLMLWLHKAVFYGLALDARLLPARMRGTSAYAVCDIASAPIPRDQHTFTK